MKTDGLIDAVKNIDVASKSIQMYSETHPRTQQAVELALSTLERELAGRGMLTVSLAEGNLLIEGAAVEKGNPLIERFARDIFARNIHSLTFFEGVSKTELTGFMRLLNLKPQRIKDMGGFEKVLEGESIRNIQANKIKYGIIGEDGVAHDQAGGGGGGGGDQAILSQLLEALQAAGITGAPAASANLEQPAINANSPDAGDSVFRILNILGQSLPSVPQGQEETKKKFLEMFRSFSPEMKAKLLISAVIKGAAADRNSVSSFYRELSPQELEAAVLASLQHGAEPEVRSMVGKLSQEDGITFSDSLKKRIIDAGFLARLERHPWDDLLSRESLSAEEIHKLPSMFELMLKEGALAEADRLSKKLFGYLSTGTHEQKLAAIPTIPEATAVLSHNEKWKSIDVSLTFVLTNCFRKEADPEVLGQFCLLFLRTLGQNFEAGKLRECQDQMTLIKSRVAGQESASASLAEGLKSLPASFQEAVLQGGGAGDAAVNIVQACERGGSSYLLDLLGNEEDQRKRKRLLDLIDGLPVEFLLPEIEKRLSDERWYVVRNMVTILDRLNIPQGAPLLERAASHTDPKVAKEIVKKLYKATSPSDEPVVVRLMTHPDKAIRLQGIHLASLMLAASAAPVLVRIVEGTNPMDTDLRVAAYQTLLRIKPQDAVLPAMALLERKAAGKTDIAERNAAVKILGEVNREQHRSFLQKVASGDGNAETRQLAHSYL